MSIHTLSAHSWSTRAALSVLQTFSLWVGFKKHFLTADALHKHIQNPKIRIPPPIPNRVAQNHQILEDTRYQRPVFHLLPRSKNPAHIPAHVPTNIPTDIPAIQIMYLHGGAYIGTIMDLHWHFVAQLLQDLSAHHVSTQATVPLYGLAPEFCAQDAYPWLLDVYRQLSTQGPVVLMGDSAGAGLALGLSLMIQDLGYTDPAALVLLCPWLDVTTQDPSVAKIDPTDPLLAPAGLIAAGKLWAKNLPVTDPMISPLLAIQHHSKLPPTLAFAAGRDILCSDALRLEAIHPERVTVYTNPHMPHDWMLSPLPEAKEVRAKIVEYLAQIAH